jgi:hypothetical protein
VIRDSINVASISTKIASGDGGHLLTCRQDGTATKIVRAPHWTVTTFWLSNRVLDRSVRYFNTRVQNLHFQKMHMSL